LTIPTVLAYTTIILIWPLPEGQEWHLSTPAKLSIFLASVLFINAQTAETVLRASGRMRTELILATIGNVIFLLCVIGSAIHSRKIDDIAFAMAIGRLIHFTHSTLIVRKIASGIKTSIHQKDKLNFLKENRHFALQAVAATTYLQVDSILIGYLLGPESVANYQLFFRIVLGLGIVADASASIKLKALSECNFDGLENQNLNNHRSNERFLASAVTALSLTLMLGLVIILNQGHIFSKTVSSPLNHSHLIQNGLVSVMLSVLVFIRFHAAHLGVELTARHMQRTRANGAIGALTIITLLCLITIPFAGIAGAAISNLIGNIALTVFYMKMLR
jgi:hypothetical protein